MLSNYDPGLVVVTFGSLILSGYADGAMIAAQRDEDAYSKVVGSQGDTVRVRNRNRNGMVTVNLQQSSPINTALSAIAALDEVSNLGVKPLQIKDLNGTTLVAAPAAWIRKVADVALSQSAENREWIFDCYNMGVLVGGSIVLSA